MYEWCGTFDKKNIPSKSTQRWLCVNSLPDFVCKLRLDYAFLLYCCTISISTISINRHSTPSSKLRDSVVKSTLFLSFKGYLIMHESFSTCLATARIYSLRELHMSCWIVERNGGEAWTRIHLIHAFLSRWNSRGWDAALRGARGFSVQPEIPPPLAVIINSLY